MGWLSTHVLDTARGAPAVGMMLTLWQIERGSADQNLETQSETQLETRSLLKRTQTNADGRTDEPLLRDAAFQPGIYELVFDVGHYFAKTELSLPEPPFLTWVPLQFGIADARDHYHVPLLVSPWAYSTYRGS